MRKVKMNLGPAHLAALARRFARGLTRIPEPKPIYVIHQHEYGEGSTLIVAYRSRKLAEEAARKMIPKLTMKCDQIDVEEVPVRG